MPVNLFKHTLNSADMTLDLKISARQPSQELLNLIDEVGKLGRKLTDLFEKVKKKGTEEGFSDE
jgi:hypothetical protein